MPGRHVGCVPRPEGPGEVPQGDHRLQHLPAALLGHRHLPARLLAHCHHQAGGSAGQGDLTQTY